MRSDMGKVVIERPRRGSGAKNLKMRKVVKIHHDGEEYYHEGPLHIGNGRISHAYDKKLYEKDQTDVLGPIHRFLDSKVGKPWNDTWSEICKQLSGKSHPVEHVLGHIKSDVDIHNNSVYPYQDFVVIDGILNKRPHPSWRRKNRKSLVPINDVDEFNVRIKGCWFLAKFIKYSIDWRMSYSLRRDTPKFHDCEVEYKRNRYFCKKIKSLSKKEIQQIDLEKAIFDISEYQKGRYQ